MASEPGLIAAYVERSLERKSEAEQTERRPVQQPKETSRPQGRQQTGQSVARTTPNREKVGSSGRGACGCCGASDTSDKRESQRPTVTPTIKDIVPGDADDEPLDDAQDNVDGGGLLWDDPEFPTPSTITLPDKTFSGIQWLRPPAITAQFGAKPQFIVSGAVHYDINQGDLGDCWYLSAVACLATSRDRTLLGRILPTKQSFQRNYTGKFWFRFWDFGVWRKITIDDRIPTVKDRSGVNRLIFGRNSDQPYEFWVPLMEKAFVKLKGGRYENVERGNANTALIHFTGGVSFSEEPSKMESSAIFNGVHYALVNQHGLVSCITPDRSVNGLVKSHVYCISSSMTVQLDGGTHQLLRLYNPWGKGEWTGPWGDGSREFRSIKRQYNLTAKDDGEFWMSAQDVKDNFISMNVCFPGPGKKDKVKDSTEKSFLGRWSGPSAAGGDPGNANFWNNPQYEFTVAQKSDGSATSTVVVSVMQSTNRTSDNKQIGFYLFQLRQNFPKGKINASNFGQLIQRQVSGKISNGTEVVSHDELVPGYYLVVPCTWTPGIDMKFLLRIFTDTEISSWRLDVPSSSATGLSSVSGTASIVNGAETGRTSSGGVDEVEKLFQKCTGGDDQMDAGEFAAAVREILGKEDANSMSPAGTEASRSLLALFGYSRSHLLNVEEFRGVVDTLSVWKQKFESLRGSERGVQCRQIRDAFPTLVLSDEVITQLQRRYTSSQNDQDSILSLHSFVHCCCRIVCMLGEFERLAKMGAVVRNDRSLTEWLISTLPY